MREELWSTKIVRIPMMNLMISAGGRKNIVKKYRIQLVLQKNTRRRRRRMTRTTMMKMKMVMIFPNMICGVVRRPELKRKQKRQTLNQILPKEPEVDQGVNLDPETETRDPEVLQALARTPQGLGAEVGGRETGEDPRGLVLDIVEGKVA